MRFQNRTGARRGADSVEQKTAVLLITHCGLLFGQAWYSAAPCTPSHSPHTFPPKNAARCDGLCNALHRPSQRAAMRDAPHYVFCPTLVHDSPPCAPGLHSTLSAPSQSRPYSYQKCGRRDEGQAWYKNPYPPGQTCICARFPTEVL